MAKRIPTPADIFRFYVDGFRSMTLGRTLWAIILLKLFIMFAILRLFFFPDQLAGMSQEQRSEHVLEQLTIPDVSGASPSRTAETKTKTQLIISKVCCRTIYKPSIGRGPNSP